MLIEIIIIIVGILLMNFTVISDGGGLGALVYCFDIPTLICLLVLSLPILFRRGLWRDFFRAFRLLKKTYVCSLADLKRTKEAVALMQKQVLYAGIIVSTMGIIYVLGYLSDLQHLGPCMAVVVLSILYMAVLELLLLPLQYEVKQRLITYMEMED